jgi:hypothetical protein
MFNPYPQNHNVLQRTIYENGYTDKSAGVLHWMGLIGILKGFGVD